MPAINPNFPPSGETNYGRLRRLCSAARANGHPHVIDPATGLPQLATGVSAAVVSFPAYANAAAAIAAGFANQNAFAPTDVRFYPTGGSLLTHNGSYIYACFTNVASTNVVFPGNSRGANTQRIVFYPTASKVLIQIGTNTTFRLLVNDRYVSLTPTVQGATYPFVLLDFTSSGGRLRRKITVELFISEYVPSNVFLLPQDELLPAPTNDRLRMIVLGDSTSVGTGCPCQANSWAEVMMDALGVTDAWLSGIGGTGYNYQNPLNSGNNLPSRMGDATNYSHDAAVFAMNVNDVTNALTGPANLAAIQPNFDVCYNTYRASCPITPLFILGVMAFAPATNPNILAYEQLLAAYVAAKNDPNTFFIPVMTDPEPWQTGTGWVGNNTNDGNAQIYVGALAPGTAPTITAGGTGWAVNDLANSAAISSLDNPTQVKITAVSGGAVTAVSVVTKGTFTQSQPANPVAMTAVSPSAGSGLSLTFGAYTSATPHLGGYGYLYEGLRCANSIINAIAKKP